MFLRHSISSYQHIRILVKGHDGWKCRFSRHCKSLSNIMALWAVLARAFQHIVPQVHRLHERHLSPLTSLRSTFSVAFWSRYTFSCHQSYHYGHLRTNTYICKIKVTNVLLSSLISVIQLKLLCRCLTINRSPSQSDNLHSFSNRLFFSYGEFWLEDSIGIVEPGIWQGQ